MSQQSSAPPIVIGFAPCPSSQALSPRSSSTACSEQADSPTAAGAAAASSQQRQTASQQGAAEGTGSPSLTRNSSGRTSSSPGLLSLQLSLQHSSQQGCEDCCSDDYDSEEWSDEDELGDVYTQPGPMAHKNAASDMPAASSFSMARSRSQPISIPTQMWVKDPAVVSACHVLQRERTIRRQQYEQAEAVARQQAQFQAQQLQQYQLYQQQMLLQAQKYHQLSAQGVQGHAL